MTGNFDIVYPIRKDRQHVRVHTISQTLYRYRLSMLQNASLHSRADHYMVLGLLGLNMRL